MIRVSYAKGSRRGCLFVLSSSVLQSTRLGGGIRALVALYCTVSTLSRAEPQLLLEGVWRPERSFKSKF
jgi:hypothetical protein